MIDKIEFKIINETKNFYDIDVILNGTSINKGIFNTKCFFSSFCINEINYFLCTCDCGQPECAGIHEKIKQTQNDNHVYWNFPTDNSYRNKKLNYKFNKKSLLQQIESLKNNIIALEHNNKFVISQTYITFDNNHNEITKYYNLVPSIERLEKVYKHKDKIKKLIYLNFPRLYKKKFYIKYNHYITIHPYSLKDIIYKLYNSQIGKSNFTFYKIYYACLALENTLFNYDYQKLIYLFSHYHRQDENDFIDYFYFDLDIDIVLGDFAFDINKLEIGIINNM